MECWSQNRTQEIWDFFSHTTDTYLIVHVSCLDINRFITSFTFLERAYYAAPLQTTEKP